VALSRVDLGDSPSKKVFVRYLQKDIPPKPGDRLQFAVVSAIPGKFQPVCTQVLFPLLPYPDSLTFNFAPRCKNKTSQVNILHPAVDGLQQYSEKGK
jgi:hypothetical protein